MITVTTFTLALITTSVLSAFLAWHAKSFLGLPTAKEKKLSAELQDTKHELTNYRQNINTHFEKTASLFNDLSKQYKNLYDHLKASSKELCNSDYHANLLEYNSSENNNKNQQVETKDIKHNWHPTFFEARDAQDTHNRHTDSETSKDSLNNQNKETKQKLDIDDDLNAEDLLRDLEKLDDLDYLCDLDNLDKLDSLENLTLSEPSQSKTVNKSTLKEKLKVISGRKSEANDKKEPSETKKESLESV